jgi:hypothetical protein
MQFEVDFLLVFCVFLSTDAKLLSYFLILEKQKKTAKTCSNEFFAIFWKNKKDGSL